MNSLTLGDLEYYERKTGQPITSFDSEAGGALAPPMIAMCALMLYRGGGFATRDDAYTAATDLTMDEATALVGGVTTDTAGE
ncbi:MAG: hypothetical protein HXK09_10730 [Actinomyces bouchesdurhonensis]|uniref:Uncharacterized protein n=1 Tax=Actinomyces bouchesdurhonensis TaxID=1852361 RepID=A0A929RRZ6_9ACTO|nr:hypothetical protein [Actinomyces bouchesdurhonensis]